MGQDIAVTKLRELESGETDFAGEESEFEAADEES